MRFGGTASVTTEIGFPLRRPALERVEPNRDGRALLLQGASRVRSTIDDEVVRDATGRYILELGRCETDMRQLARSACRFVVGRVRGVGACAAELTDAV